MQFKPTLPILSIIVFIVICVFIANTTVNKQIAPTTGGLSNTSLGDTVLMDIKSDKFSADKNYLLYISDTAMTGIQPQITQGDQKFTLGFQLLRNSDSEKAWATIFHRLKSFSPMAATVCVGPDDHSKPLDCITNGLKFQTMSQNKFWAWLVISLATIAFFVRAITSSKSTLLRDWQPANAATPRPLKPATYSLGRFQMAFWFILVVLAFLFIWLVTGDAPAISSSTLALMGIGAGTALGAAVIDNSSTEAVPESKSFMNDLLTNSEGYGFHRIQMFIWTLVLGITFITSVMTNLSMPEFNDTLLALMGISSGTYLGFKIPEKKAQDPAAS